MPTTTTPSSNEADSAPDQPNLLRVETADDDRDWSLLQAAAIGAAEAAAAIAAAEVAAEAALTARAAVDAASAAAAKAAHRAREVASDAADAVAAIAAVRQSRSQRADASAGRHASPEGERTCAPSEPGIATAPAELAEVTAEAARRVARRVELVAAAAASAAVEAAIVIAGRVECEITSAAADVDRASLRPHPFTARERRRSPMTEAQSPAAEASAAAATIRSLHRSGASALTIAAKLNRVGSRTRRDARWSSRSVLDMLQLFPVRVDDVLGARPQHRRGNAAR